MFVTSKLYGTNFPIDVSLTPASLSIVTKGFLIFTVALEVWSGNPGNLIRAVFSISLTFKFKDVFAFTV